MTLQQFIDARREYCRRKHTDFQTCLQWCGFVQFTQDVCDAGIVELKVSFTKNFPRVKYSSTKAVRLLMQLPLIIMEIASEGPGFQRLCNRIETRN